jgi:hypothetical protein
VPKTIAPKAFPSAAASSFPGLSAATAPSGLAQLLSNAEVRHQQQAASKAAEDTLLEERAQEFRDKDLAKAGKKKRVSTKGLPESPPVAATKVDEPKVKKAAAKTASERAKTAPAPKRSKGRSKGRRSSHIAEESKSDTDAAPTSPSEGEHTNTPLGTVPAPDGTATPDASAGSASSAVAADPSSAGPVTAAATATLQVLSGGTDTEAIGSQGISRTRSHDNIGRSRVAGPLRISFEWGNLISR